MLTSRNIYLKMETLMDLSPSERQVINYLLENATDVISDTIVEIGNKTYTSASTITRVYKKLDYNSFTDFKTALIKDLPDYNNSRTVFMKKETIKPDDSVQAIIHKTTNNSLNALLKVTQINSAETFQTAVNHMKSASHIHLFGSGVSNLICRDALQKGLRSGCDITAHSYYSEMMMQARLAKPDDISIVVSYTGETDEIIRIVKILKLNKVTVISITGDTNNTIAKLSSLNLYVDARESFYRVGGMDSRMSMQHILDILFSIYFSQVKTARESIEKSMETEDFAKTQKQ